MNTGPPKRELADVLVNGVEEFVRTRREAGMSWRRIANELRDATNQKVDVTYETVRGWYADKPWANREGAA